MSILVSYNQICVFNPDLHEPFNDWNDAHVRQGFSWRPGSVSFAAAENVETDIDIARCVSWSLNVRSVRAIVVPFTVPALGRVVVGSVGDERDVEVEAGLYELVFDLGWSDGSQWCRLSFVPNGQPSARILRADPEITKTTDLVMDARPAG
jgi:hypothetical protein